MDIAVLDIWVLDKSDIGQKSLGHEKLDILVVLRERASKRVLRAWEKVWRGSAGSVHHRNHKLVDSYNTEEDR